MGSLESESLPPISSSSNHIVLFPFMAKGHIIPLLHLARRLRRRSLTVTLFTTPGNLPYISRSLSDTAVSIITIPFPSQVPEIPPGIESTDSLPSMSLFPLFIDSTQVMQPYFEVELQKLGPVRFIVSDGFLYWTLEAALKLNIPRLAFYGINNFVGVVSVSAFLRDNILQKARNDDELITLSMFPWIKVCKNDFDEFAKDPSGPHHEVFRKMIEASGNSYGLVTNSFEELEPVFFETWNKEGKPKAYCVGPLCPVAAEPRLEKNNKPFYIQWLDKKLEVEKPVLYVAFGSQAEVSFDQLKEIATGLEKSDVNFLWAIKLKKNAKEERFHHEYFDEFEERVKEKGLVVKEWVDQKEILFHPSVKGFLSHCGWNSVMESIVAAVPILAWPLTSDQPLNARLVVEELGVGLRADEGRVKGFIKGEVVERMVRGLMVGEKGKEVKKTMKEVSKMAKIAVGDGGSSSRTLDLLIRETCLKVRYSGNLSCQEHSCLGM